ncbi:MAG: NADH-quinone oxidoreductase subunit H [Ignavibacteriales bacterium]|nr:NADH-quinone oxidoreductase subunit H [Ignavibacteriales bacterium]
MELIQSLLANEIVVAILLSALPLVFILVYALVTLYMEMKVAAHMQDRLAYMRTGWHGVLQPFADILKLLQKEDIIPFAADKLLFQLAPYVVFIGTYAGFAFIPFSSIYIGSNINLGAFFLVAAGSLVVIGILMGGWASNNKWSIFGGLRSASQMISYEIPTALAIVIAVMITGSLNLQDIVKFQEGGIHNWLLFGGPMASVTLTQKLLLIPFTLVTFIILFTASLAEVNRTPFDLPEAESELVQGFNTEYSGMRFAMFYLAEYANMFLVSGVAVSLFLGGWSSPFGSLMSGTIWGIFWFVLKAMVFVFLQIWIRWTLPRLRVDQLMYTSWKVLTPLLFGCLFAIGLILVW